MLHPLNQSGSLCTALRPIWAASGHGRELTSVNRSGHCCLLWRWGREAELCSWAQAWCQPHQHTTVVSPLCRQGHCA